MKTFCTRRTNAVILSRDTMGYQIEVRWSQQGLIKKRNDTFYFKVFYYSKDGGIRCIDKLSFDDCKDQYGGVPAVGTAWLVYPAEAGYFWWERIVINFSEDNYV